MLEPPALSPQERNEYKKKRVLHSSLLSLQIIPTALIDIIYEYFKATPLELVLSYEFSQTPWYLATNESNDCIIVTEYNRFLMFYNSQIVSIGDSGKDSEKGEFLAARDVCIVNNKIYITDLGANCVQIFNTSGNYLSTFYIEAPWGIVHKENKLYITLVHKRKIGEYDLNGKLLRFFQCSLAPFAFTCYLNEFYVTEGYFADNHYQIEVLDIKSGKSIRKFGNKGNGGLQLNCPRGIVVKNNLLYISDGSNHRIQVWSLKGDHIQTIGVEGSEKGSFKSPHGIHIIDNEIVIADWGNKRIQMLK